MKKFLSVVLLVSATIFSVVAKSGPVVNTAYGKIEGVEESGIKVFKGVPFAKPPVGDLRWKAPQPLDKWKGVKKTVKFGPNPMQQNLFGDMVFSTDEMSEDCLYLNIWTPTKTFNEKLPVFIYFNGGGFLCGSGSEPRYAGMTYAKNGVIAITTNYREGIFGFFAHKELSAETDYYGSGNYGFMDQVAAIKWVKENIAAFGGDPDRLTIMGESAGSFSVSALMASPLSRDLINQAMGSSGSALSEPWVELNQAEKEGESLMRKLDCRNIAELRAMTAEDLMIQADLSEVPSLVVDGYFMPKQPVKIYMAGKQAKVPCFIGGNNAEMGMDTYMNSKGEYYWTETLRAIQKWLKGGAPGRSEDKILDMYGITVDRCGLENTYELASDLFIGYSTWKWLDLQSSTSSAPIYRYLYCHARPPMVDNSSGLEESVDTLFETVKYTPKVFGAVHSADIEYQMGNLDTNKVFAWTNDDYAISDTFMKFSLNFIKYGNPNGKGLPKWSPVNGEKTPPVMIIDLNSHQELNPFIEERYQLLNKVKMYSIKKLHKTSITVEKFSKFAE